MNKTLLTAVSAVAFMASLPAFAADVENNTTIESKTDLERTQGQSNTPEINQQDIERGWEKTKDSVSETAEDISKAAEDVYDNVASTLTGEDTQTVSKVNVDENMTAKGIIGQPVMNVDGERVAKVKDIIVDQNGEAVLVILADGDFTGLGKIVALNYSDLIGRKDNGKFIARLDEASIENMMAFSYDRADYSDTVQVIPANGYSVAKLINSNLIDPAGEKLAHAENISFRNGEADKLIVKYGDILGLGGEQAALNYNDVALTTRDNELTFRLSSNQVMQFKTFKNTSIN